MSLFLLAIAYVAGLIILAGAILWIIDKLRYPAMTAEELRKCSAEYEQRLLHPDFEAVERFYSCKLPESLKSLYADKAKVLEKDFEVAAHPDAPEIERHYIAFYDPIDGKQLENRWPGREKLLEFADDGCGNAYLIDPKFPDPPVLFHDHETEEFSPVCQRLSEFLKWPKVERE